MKLPLNNLNYPIRLVIGISSGSGFFISYKSNIYLVTAKHVLYQEDLVTKASVAYGDKLRILCYTLSKEKISDIPRIYEVDVQQVTKDKNLLVHDSVDLVILKLGYLNDDNKGVKFSTGITKVQDSEGSIVNYDMDGSRKFDSVEITNDIFVLGYPSSVGVEKQIDPDFPLARKGIVAGKNLLNRTLILDCPVYGGNSGGLVLEINYEAHCIHLIGIVVQFVPFVDIWENKKFPGLLNKTLQNSGYSIAIPVDYIYDLMQKMAQPFLAEQEIPSLAVGSIPTSGVSQSPIVEAKIA
ncbi:MAG: trypsin-like peptidase domain-containing protein [Patescibacteria group bacterium]